MRLRRRCWTSWAVRHTIVNGNVDRCVSRFLPLLAIWTADQCLADVARDA